MIVLFFKGFAWCVAKLPWGIATAMANAMGWCLAVLFRARRGVVMEALTRAFPEKSPAERQAIFREVWHTQALNIMELFRYAGGKEAELEARVRIVGNGAQLVEEARARGKGLLILIAHYGNFDLMGMCSAHLFGYPVSAITKKLKNGTLDALWDELRRRAQVTPIPARNAYRVCLRVLRNNELVGFMLDQNRPANQGVFVPFFGKLASTTPGLALMSAQTGAPVLPTFMRRTPDGRHELYALPLIPPPTDHKPETLLATTATYTRILEDEIRKNPGQWLWLHKRWKSRPPAESAPTSAAPDHAPAPQEATP